jgi:HSP20 family protein
MTTKVLTRMNDMFPDMFEDFFKPWNEKFSRNMWGKMLTVPAVNIIEDDKSFTLSLAAPGLKKEDFHIQMNGTMLTISSEKEEQKEEKDERMTRNEYNFTSFTRTFNVPEDIEMKKIAANYENGVLTLMLPKKEEAKRMMQTKNIKVN